MTGTIVAVAFHDGAVTPASFTPERVRDPALRPLIAKMTIDEDKDFTQRFPQEGNSRMEVTTVSDQRLVAHTRLSQRAPAQSALRCGRGGNIPAPGWGSVNGAAMQHSPGIALESRAPAKSAGAVRHTRSIKGGRGWCGALHTNLSRINQDEIRDGIVDDLHEALDQDECHSIPHRFGKFT